MAVLDVIAQCKREASTTRDRQYYDGLAIGIITQEIEPLKMADNLNHWLELTKTITPLGTAAVVKAHSKAAMDKVYAVIQSQNHQHGQAHDRRE